MKRLYGFLALSLASGLAMSAPGVALKDENMLSRPNSTSAAVGKMSKGMAVDITAKEGGWFKIKAGSVEGWVRLLSVRAGSGGVGGDGLEGVAGLAGAVTQKSDPSRVVAVAGVRGLNEEDLKGARYSAAEMAKLKEYTVTPEKAREFAEKSGLKQQKVAALPNPRAQSDTDSGSF